MKAWFKAIALILVLCPLQAYASDQGLMGAAMNMNIWVPKVLRLVGNLAFCAGVFFFLKSARTMVRVSEGQAVSREVIFELIVASCLVALPKAMGAIGGTLGFGNEISANILSGHLASGSGTDHCGYLMGIYLFVRLVGLIFFIKSLMSLIDHGKGKDVSVGSVLTQMLAGSACMNITKMAEILAATIGFPGMLQVMCIT